MAIWGRRASSPDNGDEDDAAVAPGSTAAEARRRRGAAALRRALPKFASVTSEDPDGLQPPEPPSAATPLPHRFPRRGDPVAPAVVPPARPQPLAQHAQRHEASSPDASPVPRRQFPQRSKAQEEQPAISAVAAEALPAVSLPPRRLTPSQRQAAAQAELAPGPRKTLRSRRTAALHEPEPHRWPGGWLGRARPKADSGPATQPEARVVATPILPGRQESGSILDAAAFPAESLAPSLGPSRRKRAPDLLGALLAKRAAAVLPDPPAPPSLRPRPALRYPRPAVPGPSLKPAAASCAKAEAPEALVAKVVSQPPAPTNLPIEQASSPMAATPTRQRAATFLAPLPQRETPGGIQHPGDRRETLRDLVPRVFDRLRRMPKPLASALAQQADQALTQSGHATPPVPPGIPAQPLAARLRLLLRPPPPLIPPGATQAMPSKAQAVPFQQEGLQGTDPRPLETDVNVPPPPIAQRPRPPGRPIRGVMPWLMDALQPKAMARSDPKSSVGLQSPLLPHRQLMAMMPASVTESVPMADEAPTLSLGPWLVRVEPQAEPQTDPADDAPAAIPIDARDDTTNAQGPMS